MKPLSYQLLNVSIFTLFMLNSSFSRGLPAKTTQAIGAEMAHTLSSLTHKEGWPVFIAVHPSLFSEISENGTTESVTTGPFSVTVDGKTYDLHIGCRSVFIKAAPKTVVEVINNPIYFTALYGLDKPVDATAPEADGTFQARIYKLVPGLETQDYVLKYFGAWEGDSWLGQAMQIRDEKNFALRHNYKLVEPHGNGSVFREVALFLPLRWWMNLFSGTVDTVTKRELTKIDHAIRCAAESIGPDHPLTMEITRQCHKKAEK